MSPGGNICTLASRKGLFSAETLGGDWAIDGEFWK